jgi:hypothetical protein
MVVSTNLSHVPCAVPTVTFVSSCRLKTRQSMSQAVLVDWLKLTFVRSSYEVFEGEHTDFVSGCQMLIEPTTNVKVAQFQPLPPRTMYAPAIFTFASHHGLGTTNHLERDLLFRCARSLLPLQRNQIVPAG